MMMTNHLGKFQVMVSKQDRTVINDRIYVIWDDDQVWFLQSPKWVHNSWHDQLMVVKWCFLLRLCQNCVFFSIP